MSLGNSHTPSDISFLFYNKNNEDGDDDEEEEREEEVDEAVGQ